MEFFKDGSSSSDPAILLNSDSGTDVSASMKIKTSPVAFAAPMFLTREILCSGSETILAPNDSEIARVLS